MELNFTAGFLTDGSQKSRIPGVNWEFIADNFSEAGWGWGLISAIDSNGRTIWIADSHRGDGTRFVVRAEEKADGVSPT